MKKIYIKDINKEDKEKITLVAVVKDGSKELFSKVVSARSKNELNNTLKAIIVQAEVVESDFFDIREGEWIEPTLESISSVIEPTKEEKDEIAYLDAKMQLSATREDLKLGLISQTEYDAEVAKVKALKQ